MLATAAISLSAQARAQVSGCQPKDYLSTCIDADNLWPHAGNTRWWSLAPAQLNNPGGHDGATTVGLASSFTYRPIGFQVASPDPDGSNIYAVNSRLRLTFLTSIGVGRHLQLNLAAPMVLHQTGSSTADIIGAEQALPRSASGDLRFGVAVQIVRRSAPSASYPPSGADGPALALRLDIAAPSGDDNAFVSYRATTYAPALSFDQHIGRWWFGADLGMRVRRHRRLAGTIIGSQLSASVGAGIDILADGWLSAQLEAWALFSFHQQLEQTTVSGQYAPQWVPSGVPHIPAEWLLSVRTAGLLDGRLRASLGGGGSIPTASLSATTAPAARAVASVRYLFDN